MKREEDVLYYIEAGLWDYFDAILRREREKNGAYAKALRTRDEAGEVVQVRTALEDDDSPYSKFVACLFDTSAAEWLALYLQGVRDGAALMGQF